MKEASPDVRRRRADRERSFRWRVANLVTRADRPYHQTALDEWRRGERDMLRLPVKVQCEILRVLRELVGTIQVSNGTERVTRHPRPTDLTSYHKDPKARTEDEDHQLLAASLLELGELEAAVETAVARTRRESWPPSEGASWDGCRANLEAVLKALSELPNPTAGAEELSRQTHSTAAIDYLKQFDFLLAAMRMQMESPDDQHWFEEAMKGAALLAMLAGRHAQAAFVKHIEPDAVSGEKQRVGRERLHNMTYGTPEERETRKRRLVEEVDAWLAEDAKKYRKPRRMLAYQEVAKRHSIDSKTVQRAVAKAKKT